MVEFECPSLKKKEVVVARTLLQTDLEAQMVKVANLGRYGQKIRKGCELGKLEPV